jgi:alpha-beta hydrolase superfamily lysophospholipase
VRRALSGLAAILALRCAGGPPPPGSFYTAPAGDTRTPGRLLRSEPIQDGDEKELPPGAKAWRVLYASTGLDGKLIEVSGIVVAPDLPAPLAGRPVVAWAHPTTGIADRCAPSLRREVFDTIPHLTALVALDYVVVATDYPGLGTAGTHPYLVGESEGRAVLDSVRAARGLEAAGAGTRFVAWGHSQGGQAALFAGELAGEYAPELQLAGVAAIAPATELALLLEDDIAERAGRLIAGYSLWSWSRIYGAGLSGVVAPSTLPVIDRMSGDCIETWPEVLRAALDSFGLHPDFIAAGAWETEPWNRLLEENRPGRRPTRAPIFVAQGQDDEIVRPAVTADFVAGLCRRGETVRFESLPGVDHMRAGRASATAAIQWMRSRFEGEPAKNGCAAISISR